jgi:tRNA nucleotidyltransferase (CCA-adding enzyme)
MKWITNRICLLALFFFFVSDILSHAQQSRWLPYAPTTVELRGTMLKVVKYGPPGYGENPKSDAKYQIPMLLLVEPARVKGNSTSPVNKEDLTNVSFVQLIFLNTPANEYWRYVDLEIIATGTLFRAETGHHYTDLLMK